MSDERPVLVRLNEYEDVQKRPGQNPELTVLVTISGGGYRAANFALGALLALEQIRYESKSNQNSNLLNEVDYFSTVSGGGMAAALSVLAQLNKPENTEKPLLDFVHCSGVLKAIRRNATSRLIYYKLKPDVALTPKTSGDELQSWLDSTLLQRRKPGFPCELDESDSRSYTLGEVFKPPGSPVVTPYWFMNATDMSDGKIFPFTPVMLNAYQISSFWHKRQEPISEAGHSYDVPLAVGVRSSMNFPAGIPATRLVSNGIPRNGRVDKYLYLTDGGESDNLGALVAADALFREMQLQKSTARIESKRRLVIVIDAFRGLGSAPSVYSRPNPPGLFTSVLRATSLPLDAHRLRVKENFHEASPKRPSILDVLSNDGDVAVAYVHMEREREASRIGTTLHLTPAQQRSLICAGIRQTLVALGKTAMWKDLQDLRNHRFPTSPPDELDCAFDPIQTRCEANQKNCSEIVSFNRTSKKALIQKLVTNLEDTLSDARNAMGNVRRQMDQNLQDQARAHYQRLSMSNVATEFDNISVSPLPSSAFDSLTAAVDRYLHRVNGTLKAIETDPVKPVAGTSPEPPDPEPSGWRRFFDLILSLLGRPAEESNPEIEENDLKHDEQTTNSIPTDGNEVPAGSEHENIQTVLEEIENALRSMQGTASELLTLLGEIPRDGKHGIVAEIQAKIRALKAPHDKLLAHSAPSELHRIEDLYGKLREIMSMLNEPAEEAATLSSLLEANFHKALNSKKNELTTKFKSEMDDAETRTKAAIKMYEDTDMHNSLNNLYGSLNSLILKTIQAVPVVESASNVCKGLRNASTELAIANNHINRITGKRQPIAKNGIEGKVWNLDQQLDIAWSRSQVKELQIALKDSHQTIKRLTCLWPNIHRRDSFDYDAFIESLEISHYADNGCNASTSLPYDQPCLESAQFNSNR